MPLDTHQIGLVAKVECTVALQTICEVFWNNSLIVLTSYFTLTHDISKFKIENTLIERAPMCVHILSTNERASECEIRNECYALFVNGEAPV